MDTHDNPNRMQVIGAGFGRTGTTSLKSALELLCEGRCHHMEVVLQEKGRLEPWHAFATGETQKMDWESVLGDFVASVDFPTCMYFEELMETFPDAKVILSVRDPESWFKSWQTLMNTADKLRLVSFASARIRRAFVFLDGLITDQVFDGKILDRDTAIAAFERHNAHVKEAVPAERLLVYNVKEGWEPLCAFLGKPVPEAPFPHLNSGDGRVRKILVNAFGLPLPD